MGHKKEKSKEKVKKSKVVEESPAMPDNLPSSNEEDGADKFPKHMYEDEIVKLQVELVRLQEWIKYKGLRGCTFRRPRCCRKGRLH